MKQSTFCVASSIREDGALAVVMASAQERLKQANIPFNPPKLGKHITFVPPFKAAEEIEIGWLVMGLEVAHIFYCPKGVPKMAKGEKLDFFTGEKDALIVRVTADWNIKDLAERFRAILPKHTEWVYAPESYLVSFHATIGEGEGLRAAIDAKGGVEELFKGLQFQQPIQLEPPKVFEKENGLWRPLRM